MTDAPPTGYIKVSRKVFDIENGDPLWNEKREFSRWEAWIDVIQLAAWKDSRYHTTGGVIRLRRGEFVASIRHLAKRWDWSVKRVRVWLDFMRESGRIVESEGHRVCPSQVVAANGLGEQAPPDKGTVEAQRRARCGAHSGTLYLIVKYDAYQSPPSQKGTLNGTVKGTLETAEKPVLGHKIEAVKAVRTKSGSDASASAANLEAFPKAVCDVAQQRWSERIGAMPYGRFRKALLPVFQAQPKCYTGQQLAEAVEAFRDGKLADDPKYQGKWTIERFAGELHQWVRLGAMELVDEWGLATERGRVAGVVFA